MAVSQYPQWGWRQLLLANLAIAAAYAGMAELNKLLPLPPAYPSPLYPPAGVTLALAVLAGWRVLPGVLLGRFAAWLAGSWPSAVAPGADIVIVLASTALGSFLQAWVGAAALRRWVDPAIGSGRDVMRFLLIALLSCLVSASINVPVMAAMGLAAPGERLQEWLSWWAGDSIGVLLAAPLTWVVCGVPRALWRRRAGVVALPLLVAAGAVLATYPQAVRWEHDQGLQSFRLKSQQAADLMQAQFNEHLRFVETFARALGDATQMFSHEKFLAITEGYANGRAEIQGIDWAVRVPLAQRAMFEDWARREVSPDFAVRDLAPDGRLVPAAPRPEYFPILYTTPPTNRFVLGFDFLSNPQRAAAVRAALETGLPATSAPLRLASNGQTGIALFQSVGEADRSTAGVVVVLLNARAMVERAAASAGLTGFALDFRDVSGPDGGPLLLPAPRPTADDFAAQLHFDGRRYLLRFVPLAPAVATGHGLASWTVITAGLLLTGLLGALLLLVSGERVRIEAVVLDRTARLRDREARLQAILDNAGDAILTMDCRGVLVSGNAAAGSLFRYPVEQLQGLPFDQLVPAPGGASAAATLERMSREAPGDATLQGIDARGQHFPLAISVSRVLLPTECIFVCILRDLSEQVRSQERIYKLAHYDVLTGLENRFALRKRLDEHLAHARRAQEPLAVLFIDLDHFKKINDQFGHHAGDQLLVAASTRMKELLRDADTLARLGGDEFVIVLGGPLTPDSVSTVAVRLVESLSSPYLIEGATVHSGASVGVALFPDDGQDSAALLRNADTAMYAAKREGRGNFQFFSEAMNAATHEHLLLENRMWQALEREHFDVHLQAQVALDTGRVIGAEVLLRWHDPELGSVEPSRFIPIAEESGLILPLGDWVLSRAMQLLAEWRDGDLEGLRLAVNLSARQFRGDELLARLDQLLAQHRIDPARLELEITETAAMRDPEITRRLLRQLRARGFKVAIDDFGTGYSSLSYLKLFAIDRIKIDRGFVRDIESNQNDAVIVAATIALAHSLGLTVVAEGVETHTQWDFLRDKRGDEGQGFLFARPMPAHDFLHFVRTQAQPVPGS
jgi:diguanylate cyclase (GGDEF)-like protein/PAS domain S-box-containing protein